MEGAKDVGERKGSDKTKIFKLLWLDSNSQIEESDSTLRKAAMAAHCGRCSDLSNCYPTKVWEFVECNA